MNLSLLTSFSLNVFDWQIIIFCYVYVGMSRKASMDWLFITLLSSTCRLAFTPRRVNLEKNIRWSIFWDILGVFVEQGGVCKQRLIFFGSWSIFSCCCALFSFIIVVCWVHVYPELHIIFLISGSFYIDWKF